jgi:DNA replication protein DnaC
MVIQNPRSKLRLKSMSPSSNLGYRNQVHIYDGAISMTGSWLAWRLHMDNYGYTKHCPICDEMRRVSIALYKSENNREGLVRCICDVYQYGQNLKEINRQIQSRHLEKRTLTNIEDRLSDPQHSTQFVAKEIDRWLEWPSCWLNILGGFGVGKTHILSAIHDKLQPYSLYTTTGDLEALLFKAKSEDKLYEVEEALSQVPVLLLDDLGAEYGGRFVMTRITRIIDARYRMPFEFLTVCASNLSSAKLHTLYQRIADRILDRSISATFTITEKSYRREGNQ